MNKLLKEGVPLLHNRKLLEVNGSKNNIIQDGNTIGIITNVAVFYLLKFIQFKNNLLPINLQFLLLFFFFLEGFPFLCMYLESSLGYSLRKSSLP